MNTLIHLGDLPLTLAAAAAITAWLISSRALAMAIWWSIFFGLGIAVVAASKVAFLIWGAPSTTLQFQALSGHAMGVTAVCTMCLHLAFRAPKGNASAARRSAGMAAGAGCGAVMAALLVVHGDHSGTEAWAGWLLGALVAMVAIWLAGFMPARPPAPPHLHVPSASESLSVSVLVFVLGVFVLHKMPIGYLIYRVAKMVVYRSGMLALGA